LRIKIKNISFRNIVDFWNNLRSAGLPLCLAVRHLHQTGLAGSEPQRLAAHPLQQRQRDSPLHSPHDRLWRAVRHLQLFRDFQPRILGPDVSRRTFWVRYWLCHWIASQGKKN